MPRFNQKSLHSYTSRRLGQIGEIGELPGHPYTALKKISQSNGWARLGKGIWVRSLVGVFAVTVIFVTILILGLLLLLGIIPPAGQVVGDLRLGMQYNEKNITSLATAGEDWLVVGTEGLGVQALHRSSGSLGVWRTFNSSNTSGALPGDRVMRVASDEQDVWFVTGEGGLTHASTNFNQWTLAVGENGFSAHPADGDLTAARLSTDRSLLAVSAGLSLGVYSTLDHDWLGSAKLPDQITDLAFQGQYVFAASNQGVYTYDSGGDGSSLTQKSVLSLPGVRVVRFFQTPEQLFAVTKGQGLLAFNGAQWQWLVGEAGRAISSPDVKSITTVDLTEDAIWAACMDKISRYSLADHSWTTSSPDGTAVNTLASVNNSEWAGTEQGLYRFENGAWKVIWKNHGVNQLIASNDHMWGITQEGGLIYLTSAGDIKTTIDSAPFQIGVDTPELTDVIVYQGVYWVASSNAGVASYDASQHSWKNHSTGLPLNTPVARLYAQADRLWALVGASQPYNLYQWNAITTGWEVVQGVSGADFTHLIGVAWIKDQSGQMSSLLDPARQSLFTSGSFDPSNISSYTRTDNGDVYVGGREGVFLYRSGTHSWDRISSLPVVDLAWGNGKLMQITDKGSLLVGQPVGEEPVSSTPGPSSLITAALYGSQVWLSDGSSIYQYSLDTRRIISSRDVSSDPILQLRASNGVLAALTGGSGQAIYIYDDKSGGWSRLTSGSDINTFSVFGGAVYTVDSAGSMALFNKGQQTTFFSGVSKTMGNAKKVVRTSNGNFWVLGEEVVEQYIPLTGTWRQYYLPHPTDLASVISSSGQQVLLVGSGNGLYEIEPDTQNASILINQPVVGIAHLNELPYILFSNPAWIGVWDGKTIQKIGDVPDGSSEIASGSGRLWITTGERISGYRIINNSLTPSNTLTFPPSKTKGRLIDGDSSATLYWGTESECWRSQDSTWSSCPGPADLGQVRSTIDDRYGRFTWQISPLYARLKILKGLPAIDQGVLPGDRVSNLFVDGSGNLNVITVAGTWVVEGASGTPGWQTRTFTAGQGGVAAKNSFVFDGWLWEVSSQPGKPDDQGVTITWKKDPSITRSLSSGQFADELALSVRYFNGSFYLGTRGGLWKLSPISDNPFAGREPVTQVPVRSITRLAIISEGLFASDGKIAWQNRGGSWISSRWPSGKMEAVIGELGDLFWREDSKVNTAPMTAGDSTRFLQDQVFSAYEREGIYWLATPLGIITGQSSGGALSGGKLTLSVSPYAQGGEMRSDGIDLCAKFTTTGTEKIYCLRGVDWVESPSSQSTFTPSVLKDARIEGVSLRWAHSKDGLLPVLGGLPVGFESGRIASDVIHAGILDGESLVLVTDAGPYAYKDQNGLSSLFAVPDPNLVQAISSLGKAGSNLWVQFADRSYQFIVNSGGRFQRNGPVGEDQVFRPAVWLVDGRWQKVERPVSDPILGADGLNDVQLFSENGRFNFDVVNDMFADEDHLALATQAGLVVYEDAPLRVIQDWKLAGTDVKRASLEGTTHWVLTNDNVLTRAGWGQPWQPGENEKAFLPEGAAMFPDGWKPIRYDMQQLERPITASGLALDVSLMAPDGKFTFDQVIDVVPVPGAASTSDAWLMTRAGWVLSAFDGAQGRLSQYAIASGPEWPDDLEEWRAQLDPNGMLIVEGLMAKGPARLFFILSPSSSGPGVLFLPEVTQMTDGEVILNGHDFRVRSLSNWIYTSSGNRNDQIYNATVAVWPFNLDLGFTHQELEEIIDFAEDDDALWAISAHLLYRFDKNQWGLR